MKVGQSFKTTEMLYIDLRLVRRTRGDGGGTRRVGSEEWSH